MYFERRSERLETAQWCAGLCLTEERPLTLGEQKEMGQIAHRLLWKGGEAFLFATLGGIALLWLSLDFSKTFDWALITVFAAFLFLLFVPAALLFVD